MCGGLLHGSAGVLYPDCYFLWQFSVFAAGGAFLLRKRVVAALKISKVGRSCCWLVLFRGYSFSLDFALFFTAAERHRHPVQLIHHFKEQDFVVMEVFMVGESWSQLVQIWCGSDFPAFFRVALSGCCFRNSRQSPYGCALVHTSGRLATWRGAL